MDVALWQGIVGRITSFPLVKDGPVLPLLKEIGVGAEADNGADVLNSNLFIFYIYIYYIRKFKFLFTF